MCQDEVGLADKGQGHYTMSNMVSFDVSLNSANASNEVARREGHGSYTTETMLIA